MVSEKIKIYPVEPDEGDVVARRPLDKNTALADFFNSFELEDKEKNIRRFKSKEKKKRINRSYHRIIKILKKKFYKEYIHDRQYD